MVNPTRIEMSPRCLDNREVFQHTLIEDSPAVSSLTADQRRQLTQLQSQARQICLECPMFTGCLYDAIVRHDVAGYVAGTTHRQRLEMRHRLGVTVQAEDFDTLAGAIGGHRLVNHEEVLRLRRANPHESLETIAHRLGCSLSTVKRHLRKARAEAENPVVEAPKTEPTRMEVLSAFAAVTQRGSVKAAAAKQRVKAMA